MGKRVDSSPLGTICVFYEISLSISVKYSAACEQLDMHVMHKVYGSKETVCQCIFCVWSEPGEAGHKMRSPAYGAAI